MIRQSVTGRANLNGIWQKLSQRRKRGENVFQDDMFIACQFLVDHQKISGTLLTDATNHSILLCCETKKLNLIGPV